MPDTIRPLASGENLALAMMWHDAWHDAHSHIVPRDLVQLQTLDNFSDRVAERAGDFRVIGPVGDPLGFHLTRDDELDQIYLAKAIRGKGVAAKLLADAEDRIRQDGHTNAWLICAIRNDRAARFYEKNGWHRTGTAMDTVDTALGPYSLMILRFEKRL